MKTTVQCFGNSVARWKQAYFIWHEYIHSNTVSSLPHKETPSWGSEIEMEMSKAGCRGWKHLETQA